MRTHSFRRAMFGTVILATGFTPWMGTWAQEPGKVGGLGGTPKSAAASVTAAPAVKAKDLAAPTEKGLAYLVGQQHESGGWGQGGGWRNVDQGRVEGGEVKDLPDVGNTAVAALALIRAGNTPKEGKYAKQLAKAVAFLADKIEKSDKESLYVTDVKGTQLQGKIGQYIDTFLAALVLAELKGKMADPQGESRLVAALDKTMDKIERNQKADGTFAGNTGWASVLSQAVASKAINRAAQNGVAVKRELLDRDLQLAASGVDVKKGDFAAAPAVGAAGGTGGGIVGSAIGRPAAGPITGPTATAAAGKTGRGATAGTLAGGGTAPSDAGVSIYNYSAKAGGLQDQVNTTRPAAQKARRVLASESATPAEKQQAQADVDRFGNLEQANNAATNGIIKRLDDKQFIAGFGNNGGEEFLSYMNISETLLAKGGTEWLSWDKSATENLNRVQNQDGSWSGHHCITGRTFCTATALLTLMADRAPVPLA